MRLGFTNISKRQAFYIKYEEHRKEKKSPLSFHFHGKRAGISFLSHGFGKI